MLAACVNEEDLLRVQTPLTILNNFPPFNRGAKKWEETSLPATAGVEGVGIVVATAKVCCRTRLLNNHDHSETRTPDYYILMITT